MPLVVDTNLTPAWVSIYETLRQGWLTNGYAPSQTEISVELGCSMSVIQNAFRELKKHGHITRVKFEPRSARPVDMDRTLSHKKKAPPPRRDPWDELDEDPLSTI